MVFSLTQPMNSIQSFGPTAKKSLYNMQKIERNENFQGNSKKIKRSDKNDNRFQSIGGETAPKI